MSLGRTSCPPGTGGVARSDGVVDQEISFSTTPALRATPPVPGGELSGHAIHSQTQVLDIAPIPELAARICLKRE